MALDFSGPSPDRVGHGSQGQPTRVELVDHSTGRTVDLTDQVTELRISWPAVGQVAAAITGAVSTLARSAVENAAQHEENQARLAAILPGRSGDVTVPPGAAEGSVRFGGLQIPPGVARIEWFPDHSWRGTRFHLHLRDGQTVNLRIADELLLRFRGDALDFINHRLAQVVNRYLGGNRRDSGESFERRQRAIILADDEYRWHLGIDSDYDRMVEQNEESNGRARELLLSCLTPEQREEFDETESFTVSACSGRKYRIGSGTIYNVKALREDGSLEYELCAGPADMPPLGDHLLAQKLHLENDEAGFLRVANHRLGFLQQADVPVSSASMLTREDVFEFRLG